MNLGDFKAIADKALSTCPDKLAEVFFKVIGGSLRTLSKRMKSSDVSGDFFFIFNPLCTLYIYLPIMYVPVGSGYIWENKIVQHYGRLSIYKHIFTAQYLQ